MHNSYFSSPISLRCKYCPSFSYNDCTYLLSNDRFDANPIPFSSSSVSPCYTYCANCANSVYKLPLNHAIGYGLRQSSLIQSSPYRRLFWGGLNGGYWRLFISDFDEKCDLGWSYCVNEKRVSGRNERWFSDYSEKCDCERCSWYNERSVFGSKGRWGKGNEDEAEVMLSLLTEEVGEECFDVRNSNARLSRNVQVEERGNGVKSRHDKSRKNILVLAASESDSRSEYESVRFKSRKEDKKWKEDKKAEQRRSILKGDDRRAREKSGGSSCSSYYSIESREFVSDNEAEVKHENYLHESLSAPKQCSTRRGPISYDRKPVEEVDRHDIYAEEDQVFLEKENTAKGSHKVSSGAESDWRKKSEKKLTEVSIKEFESKNESLDKHSTFSEVSKNESLDKHSTFSEVDKSDQKKASFHGQYDSRKGKSTSTVTIDEGTRKQCRQTSDQVAELSESKVKSKQFIESVEIHGSNTESIFTSEDQHSRRQEKLTAAVDLVEETSGEYHTVVGHLNRQDEFKNQSQQYDEVSGRQETDIRGSSKLQRQSESMQKNWKANSSVDLISVDQTKELNCQTGHRVTKEISDTYNANIETSRRLDLRNQRDDASSASTVHYSDSKSVSLGQEFLEKRPSDEESYSSMVLKSVEKAKERHNVTEKEMLEVKSRKESHRHRQTEELASHGLMSRGGSTSQASLKLGFQSEVQQFGMNERNNTTSQTITIPSASQLVARGPPNVQAIIGPGLTAPQESCPALQHELYGQAGWDGTHVESHGDVLGSADRLQKSSMHLIDEFVEKVRHEVLTSDIQQEKKNYDTKLAYKDEQHNPKVSSRSGSGDCQSKDHHSRRSSRSTATKGPSDEMWDVTDASRQESPEIDVQEDATATDRTTVKRSGRSLWNIIADVILLQWRSHSRSHSSTSKSGGKSSPHQSRSSEAFLSGNELDESSDEHIKRESEMKAPEPISLDQQTGRIPSQSQGEGSSSTKEMDKVVPAVLKSPSFRATIESGSTSKGRSSSSIEETSRINIEGTSSGSAQAELSVKSELSVQAGLSAQAELSLQPGVRLRRSPALREVSESGNVDAPNSDSGTGPSKGGRLSRSDHLLKDKFDEWEEAHIHENEQRKVDEIFMREALLEAKKAADIWEVPVGAVLVRDGQVIARGYNLVEDLRDSTAHAEMICIQEASKMLKTWRLSETTLYVTFEPCPMCAGAILQARIDTVVWGAPNKLLGADGSWIRLFPIGGEGGTALEISDKPPAPAHPFHPKMAVRRGVLAAECADAMQQFFQLRRNKEKKRELSTPHSCLPIANQPAKLFSKMHGAFRFLFCL